MFTLSDYPAPAVAFSDRERLSQVQRQSGNTAALSEALRRSPKQFIIHSVQGKNSIVKFTISMPDGNLPSWLNPTIAGFNEIQTLIPNWDSYGAHAISADRINDALAFLGAVMRHDSPPP